MSALMGCGPLSMRSVQKDGEIEKWGRMCLLI